MSSTTKTDTTYYARFLVKKPNGVVFYQHTILHDEREGQTYPRFCAEGHLEHCPQDVVEVEVVKRVVTTTEEVLLTEEYRGELAPIQFRKWT